MPWIIMDYVIAVKYIVNDSNDIVVMTPCYNDYI